MEGFDFSKAHNAIREELLGFMAIETQRLVLPKSQQPKISVIVVTFNKAELSYQCLLSLQKFLKIPSEVIIVDNASLLETQQLLDRIDGATIIRNSMNRYYAQACHQAINIAQGEFVLLLNNDIRVQENFDSELLRPFASMQNVGAVGGKLIHPDGRLQEAGCMIFSDGIPLAYGRGANPELFEFNYTREVDYCSAAMLLLKRETFVELGGYDPRYHPAYFEDTDLCMKVRAANLRVIYSPFARAIHFEHGSTPMKSAVEMISANHILFTNKWIKSLVSSHFDRRQNILLTRERVQGKRILLIDNRVPVPANGAGYPRAKQLINSISSLGHKVCLFPVKKDEVDTENWITTAKELNSMGIEIADNDIDFGSFCRGRIGYFDLIVISRISALRRVFVDLKCLLPDVPIIFDSEALDFERQTLLREFNNDPMDDQEKAKVLKDEINYLELVDYVIFISERERLEALKHCPQVASKSSVLGFCLPARPTSNEFGRRENFLFVGGFLGNMNLNEHAVEYFAKNVMPLLSDSIEAKFKIVGSNMPASILALKSDLIDPVGYLPDLKNVYNGARVFVICHQYAGGIAWKLSEALSFGVPCVVTPLIATQMGLKEGQGVLVADTPEKFARQCELLYTDENLWKKVRQNGLDFIQKTHGETEWQKRLEYIFDFFVRSQSSASL